MANLKVDLSLNDGNLKKQINEDKKAVSEFGQTVANSGKSVQESAQNFQKAVGSITNYKKQLAQLTKEVISLEMSYSQLSDEQKKSDFGQALAQQLTEAKDKAASFKDQIIDTQNEIKQLSSDSFKSDAFAQSVDVASTSLQSFVAITQLAGGNTEKLQSVIAKLILIQTTANGVIKITNALQAQSALMLGVRKAQEALLTTAIAIRTAAETKGTIATKAATVATTALTAASKANPYVLLATAIIAVGGALYAFCKASDKATEAEKERQKELEDSKRKTEMMESVQQSYTSTLSNTYAQLMTKYTQLQSEYKSLTTNMERVAWIKTHQRELDELGLKVNDVKSAEQAFNGNTDAIVEAFKARAKAAALAAKATALYSKQMELESQYFTRYNQRAVKPGDIYNGSDISTDYGRGINKQYSFSHYEANYGQLETKDRGQTWQYTAKGAAEANKKLTQTDATLQNIQSDYNDINTQINETVNQMAELAKQTQKVQTVTNANTVKTDKKTPKVEVKPTFAEGSLADLENQLSTLQSKYKNGLITLTPSDYKQKVDELTTAIEKKKIELGLVVPEQKINEQLKKLTEKNAAISRTQKYSSFDLAVGNNLPQGNRDLNYIQSQMNFNDSLLTQLQELANAYKELGDAGKEGLEKINAEIQSVTANQTELGAKAKQYTDDNKKLEENAAKWQTVSGAVGQVGSAFSNLGSSFSLPALNIAGIIAQSVASIISAYTQAANSPAVTSTGWGWLGFALTGLAEVASVIAQIHSLSGYAEGGVIKGAGSTIHDDTLIYAHTGEMVLNQGQQSRLFNLLNGQYSSNSNNGVSGGSVEFKIRGTELYGVLKNYSKVQSLIGKNTGIK